MSWVIAALVIFVPTIHLWLHALLQWWKKQPLLFYGFAGLLGAGTLFLTNVVEPHSPVAFDPSTSLELIGYALIAVGAAGVLLSIITLSPKRFFMWAVFYPQQVKQSRVKKGIFSFIPHPAYFGYILIAIGNLLTSGKLYLVGALLWAIILIPIIIKFEEEELERRTKT